MSIEGIKRLLLAVPANRKRGSASFPAVLAIFTENPTLASDTIMHFVAD
jgi:hypothetical protein